MASLAMFPMPLAMELWLAAIIGFSIGYLLAPLFYDKW